MLQFFPQTLACTRSRRSLPVFSIVQGSWVAGPPGDVCCRCASRTVAEAASQAEGDTRSRKIWRRGVEEETREERVCGGTRLMFTSAAREQQFLSLSLFPHSLPRKQPQRRRRRQEQ